MVSFCFCYYYFYFRSQLLLGGMNFRADIRFHDNFGYFSSVSQNDRFSRQLIPIIQKGNRDQYVVVASSSKLAVMMAANLFCKIVCLAGVLAALPSARTAAMQLLAFGSVAIANESIALTVRAVQGYGQHERLLFFEY
jgi:hypothetical protein